MSFGGLFDSGSGRGGGGARTGLADAVHRSSTAMSASNISQPLLASPSLPMFNSPGLSLTLVSFTTHYFSSFFFFRFLAFM